MVDFKLIPVGDVFLSKSRHPYLKINENYARPIGSMHPFSYLGTFIWFGDVYRVNFIHYFQSSWPNNYRPK